MRFENRPKILFISTFPPRECGIATFCQDLLNGLNSQFDQGFDFEVCALHEGKHEPNMYSKPVTHVLNTEDIRSYSTMADRINGDESIAAVYIQHEFGLFKGAYGQGLLTFLYSIEKPTSVIFHTVLPEPNPDLKSVVQAITDLVLSIVVMTETSANTLFNYYGVARSKIKVIPHGTHPTSWGNQLELKRKYGLEGKTVLSTFGLISANKSIETALYALPNIVKEFPEVAYLVLGRTHPKVVEYEGEQYRDSLEAIVTKLNLAKHVIFVNEYLSLPVLLEYLKLSDLYLFTSKDPNQAVSGTFAYALSCGCPVISTPIPHAREVLKGDIGALFNFFDHAALADQVLTLLRVPNELKHKSLNAYHWSQHTIWPNVAISFANEFLKTSMTMTTIRYKQPEVNFSHLKKLTTDIGIIQFSKINIPDLDSGYTIDDNARALVATLMHYQHTSSKALLLYIDTYLDFIIYCQQSDGRFMNYVDRNGGFHRQNHYVNLEDSNARAVWALGYLMGNSDALPETILDRAKESFANALPWLGSISSPRSMGFVIKGLYSAFQYRPNSAYKSLIIQLANKLVKLYHSSSEGGWHWFEDYLTYANGVMPEALILAYHLTKEAKYLNVALNSLNFLLSQTFTKDQIKVVSNRGWQHKGQEKANDFGEQPIDVAYTILALDSFHKVLGMERYKDYLEVAYSWFLGNNHLQQIMYSPLSGGGYDGLEENNPNLNQGAESTICFLMASMTLRKYCEEGEIVLTDSLLPDFKEMSMVTLKS
ncbi:glycosyltransferase [Roseivirga echinicomitans]|uniref:Glycosyl transferase family 1 domain-containing protein n=1 Tax=Roseivirga echinicomitans TaxID=296218 RepID=A0A150XUY5_9BACT|nr:glycosyltransferase [Roseivirga echinicomitans]KYG82454.1 hypothetical protein AWN68_14440 [Roseivirga echinicomitans]